MILNIIWKTSSLIIASFLMFEIIVISPLLVLLYTIYKISTYVAPDVFTRDLINTNTTKSRKILLCIDPTSQSSLNWVSREFIVKNIDEVIITHVSEPTETIQIPNNVVTFDRNTINTKDFFIPQYITEYCKWLHRNGISYQGIILRPFKNCTVSETLLQLSQRLGVDCIVTSASERAGT